MYMYDHVCMYVSMHTCMHVCMYVYMYVCKYVCMHVHNYMCVCIFIVCVYSSVEEQLCRVL